MKNIITPKDTEHHIRAYNFRVLTKDILSATKEGREIDFADEPPAPPPPPPPPPPEQASAAAAPATPAAPAPAQPSVLDEKMLSKLDELSDRVVKLQMQLEKQESEFEKRLAEQLEAARASAYEQGKAEAASNHEAELARVKTSIDGAASKLNLAAAGFDEMLQKASAELKEMAVMIAREVISKELELSSAQIAAGYAATLISQLDSAAHAKITVNPADYSQLKAALGNERIAVVADDAIAPGCLMFNSESLNTSVSLKDRFAQARALLNEH